MNGALFLGNFVLDRLPTQNCAAVDRSLEIDGVIGSISPARFRGECPLWVVCGHSTAQSQPLAARVRKSR
jgi:hypothetical protein